ncbi:hypothetical protein Lepto7375DRAFT_0892 [Leptolyngbya sp. PCC 7375]|nr:hypothetical protein Lepto7375DRAFT_0892 [Leptolyngbya sp. PCC 7375]
MVIGMELIDALDSNKPKNTCEDIFGAYEHTTKYLDIVRNGTSYVEIA